MGDASNIPQSQTAKQRRSTTAKLAEAVRELVQEELRQSPAPPDQVIVTGAPTWQDAFWLLLVITNLVLLFSWVPKEWLQDPRVEFFAMLVPWLCSGLFFVGYAWFRQRLLAVSRRRAFKLFQLALLGASLITQFPIFSVQAHVEPQNAFLFVNGKKTDNHRERLRLRLGNYDIKVSRAEGRRQPNERRFTLRWQELFRSTWSDYEPRWALLYPVRMRSRTKGIQVHIEKLESKFDPDFLDAEQLQSIGLQRANDSRVFLTIPPEKNVASTRLPVGSYRMYPEKEGCNSSDPKDLQIRPQAGKLKFDVKFEVLECR